MDTWARRPPTWWETMIPVYGSMWQATREFALSEEGYANPWGYFSFGFAVIDAVGPGIVLKPAGKALKWVAPRLSGWLERAAARGTEWVSTQASKAWQSFWCKLMDKACFAAGTRICTPDGHKLIEQFQPGDLVLSRHENDPEGLIEVKVVEAVFARLGQRLHLHVAGQVIKTTAEHPFWVQSQGCVKAGAPPSGEVVVDEMYDTGDYQPDSSAAGCENAPQLRRQRQ